MASLRPWLGPRMALAAALALVLVAAASHADSPTAQDRVREQLEAARAEVADQFQLQAYDLLDELVYSWTQTPPFSTDTPVVLADVSVPLGFGSGLQALLENHFIDRMLRNRAGHVVPAHCPECTAWVVHSGARGTVIGRGVDSPQTLERAGLLSGARHAIFLDFEVEGTSLVLRARITSLERTLPIVYAKTLSSAISAPALLRSGEHLKSSAEARQEYLDLLMGRGPMLFQFRLGIGNYAAPVKGSAMAFPLFWVGAGVELGLTPTRAWTAGLSLGASWWPDMHTAWRSQARISRLLTGSSTSLTYPDLYAFVGASLISINGPTALLFKGTQPTTVDLIQASLGISQPRVLFGAYQLGVELRVRNRVGIAVYAESMPILKPAGIGTYDPWGIVHSLGTEVTICF